MKKIVLLIGLLLSFGECLADGVRYLVVNAKDGSQATFALADEPRISFENGELIVLSSSQSFSLNLDEVQNYAFAEQATAIAQVVEQGDVKIENGFVIFHGLTADSSVSVYSQDGKLVKTCKANDKGTAVVDLSDLSKGILILHSNNTNIKIINK